MKTKSYYITGIFSTQVDNIYLQQISINLSVLVKEEIVMKASVKMAFWEGNNSWNWTPAEI